MLVGFECDGDAFQSCSLLGFSRDVASSQCIWMSHLPPVLPCTLLPKPAAPRAGQRSCIHCRGAKALLFLLLPCSSAGPAASRVRRAALSEEGSAVLFWKVARVGVIQLLQLSPSHICLSSQLGRMAFSSCNRG